MIRIVLAIWPILLAAGILLGSNAMQTTLLAVRGTQEGFATLTIGLFLSAYYVGFIAGCRFAPNLIARVGHIRAFTAFASTASAAALAHGLLVDEVSWLALRTVTGFAFAGLAMIIESWLNELATNANRGQTLSIYRITDFSSVTALQALLGVLDPNGLAVFGLISIGLSLALVPIALTRVAAPGVPATSKLDVRQLWKISPVAAAAAVLLGLVSSAYWSMTPVFAQSLGYQPGTSGLVLGAIVAGGAVTQLPIGKLSDRIDRRLVLALCCAAAAGAALTLPPAAAHGQASLIVAATMFGGLTVPIFGLAVAHGNDHAKPGEALAVSSSILLLYGLAAALGPMIAGAVMIILGPSGLFLWVACVLASLAAFSAVRILAHDAPEVSKPFVDLPPTTPAVLSLDARCKNADALRTMTSVD